MEQLEKYYQKKVMLFIDEYDTPFIEEHVSGFYDEIKGGLAGLLHNALKLSPSLQYAMLTGIKRVAKENIFSDLNNLIVCTVMDDEYDQYFGFTEKETEELKSLSDIAGEQIVEKEYDKGLEEKIIYIGLAHCGKEVVVSWKEKIVNN